MNLITENLQHYIIPFLSFSTLALIIILLFKRIRFEHSKPVRASIVNKSETFLTEMILSNENTAEFKNKLIFFKKNIPLHKTWCKEIIIDDMIHFKRSLKGKASEQINVFYQSYHLDKYSSKLIYDFRTFYKCKGFYHFQALDYKKGSVLIKPYLKHRNPVIRSNANMAYISLTENHMESLKDLSTNISHLNMIKIMDLLHHKKIAIPKNIDQWLDTENKSVTKLGLKIMMFYNYRKQAKTIINLINHEDDSIKKEAITAIRELFLTEAKMDLTILFDKVSLKVRLEILETLWIIGDESILYFLKNTIQTTTNKDIKLKAVDCLNKLDKTALDEIVAFNFDTIKMIKHVREIYL